MEKKKLIELLPRGFQTPEEHLDAGVFMTTEDDEVSSKLVKLYDRSLVIYSVRHHLCRMLSGWSHGDA